MRDKEYRCFRSALVKRVGNPNISYDVNDMIKQQHTDMKTWTREDKNVSHLMTFEAGGTR